MMLKHNKSPKHSLRRGVAVSELAVCLPILFLITFAAIETCSAIYLKQSMTLAAYEGARVALIPAASDNNVVAQSDQILTDRNVQGGNVSVSPNVRGASPGTFIRVEVSAPCTGNLALPSFFYRGHTMSATVEMMKET